MKTSHVKDTLNHNKRKVYVGVKIILCEYTLGLVNTIKDHILLVVTSLFLFLYIGILL